MARTNPLLVSVSALVLCAVFMGLLVPRKAAWCRLVEYDKQTGHVRGWTDWSPRENVDNLRDGWTMWLPFREHGIDYRIEYA